MNEYRLDEREFARHVAMRLSAGAREVDGPIAARLQAARMAAVAAHRPARRSVAAQVHMALKGAFAPVLRPAALAMIVLAMFLAGEHWSMLSRVDSLQDVDMALLIDDLPIDAYLDTEFKEWVQDDSRS